MRDRRYPARRGLHRLAQRPLAHRRPSRIDRLRLVERPGVVGQARYVGGAQGTVLAVYLLPAGAPLSVPTTPGMPNTGAGGGTRSLPLGLLLLVAGGCTVAVVRHPRRKPRAA